MKRSRQDHPTRRIAAAMSVLRGRPAKPDYGILVVLPFLAAVGGVLAGHAVESALDHRRRTAELRSTGSGGHVTSVDFRKRRTAAVPGPGRRPHLA